MTKSLAGKAALVTGAARGIGFHIASLLAREGASLAILDLSPDETALAAKKLSSESGAKTIALGGNVAIEADCAEAVDKAVEAFGRLDILVNNAGITKDNLALRMKESDFDAVISVNLKGAFLMAKAASRIMLKQHSGRIINISSVVGQMGNAGQVNYSASKAGLIGLTKSLAREFASRDVLVNAVAPGFILTKMTEGLKDEAKQKLLEMIPLGRLGKPDDVAHAALFLAGEGSAYITGQVIAVNGGIYM
ncbi:MAG: 3-oxoacyl-[acyl-carrier-protein] reductase [Elusimicrobia bacterium GWF2_52_66]|nr:MAG: 3-oxoacyl-[acyl-carrier-protein] reductase [Elusimicrobia bacterium GWA2_51_34]OGR87345.1 MAG: 3-oxoacyl-[acyl-carrier-protein] reductase [Elusimicrobia bacterium GWF2_52_66]HAF94931.1 3-oxoacyl-[acyl-carrier-protein] reductase [Elusimicrobiota bacterium]HCE97495.1 3-oxoacyl-[acyl-carrier-protein] reductase [Elusimicrobiota bacterium]